VIEAVDHVQERALAGAVRTDDGADLVRLDVEADVAQGTDAAEGETDVLDFQQHVADPAPPRSRHAR
jgi:hypothetical protein